MAARIFVIALSLLWAPGAQTKANGPRLTVWARAGATAWSTCEEHGVEAARTPPSMPASSSGDTHLWAVRAHDCPHVPEALTLAAANEVERSFEFDVEKPDALEPTVRERKKSLARALGWLKSARLESERRGERPPPLLAFYEGKAHLASGNFDAAEQAFVRAMERAERLPARIRRLLALTVLYRGDLDRALRLAMRARLDSATGDQAYASYIYGIVLDRAGDPRASRHALLDAERRDNSREMAVHLKAILPIHERFYFDALVAEHRHDTAGAMRYFEAYLARPEPEGPERRLAERHLAELKELPKRIGGQSG